MANQITYDSRLRTNFVSSGQNKPSPRSKPSGTRPSTGRLTSAVQERRVVLRGRITRLIASCCIARLVVLAAEDQEQPIIIYIDSAGGSAAEAMGILSTMNGIRCPVLTFCRGQVGGPAAIIAAHGRNGQRSAADSTRFSLKLSGFSDHEKASFNTVLAFLADVLAKDTGRPAAEVLDWFRNGVEFNPQEAVRRGLLDAIAESPGGAQSPRT